MTTNPNTTPSYVLTVSHPTTSAVTSPDSRPMRRKFAAKLIIATSSAWQGEMYLRRDGASRYQFTTFDQFCGALRMVTGWDEGVPHWLVQERPIPWTATIDGSRRRLTRSAANHSSTHTSTGIKFIIAADRPWQGIAYRTNGGGKLSFGSFDQLLAATIRLTNWRIVEAGRPMRSRASTLARVREAR